jgi:hypothetical protein
LSVHGVIRLRSRTCRLHLDVAQRATSWPNASTEMIDKSLGCLVIGTSGPIRAGGNRGQQRDRKSSTSIGREGAICEYIEIMQISPVRATMRCL